MSIPSRISPQQLISDDPDHSHELGHDLPTHNFQAHDLQAIVGDASLQTGASGAAIALESEGEVRCTASVGESAPPQGTMLEKDKGLSGLCMRTGAILLCEDAEADPRVDAEACRSLGIRSIVTAPLIRDGKTLGIIEVLSREPHAFDDSAIELLRNLAERVTSDPEPPEKNRLPELIEPVVPDEPKFAPPPTNHAKKSMVVIGAFLAAAVLIPVGLSKSLGRNVAQTKAESPAPSQQPAKTQEQSSDDRQQANSVLSKAAQGGNKESASRVRGGLSDKANELATAYASGRGVQQDLVEAYAWHVIAFMEGNTASEEAIRSLTPTMPEQSIGEVRYRLGRIFETGDRVPKDLESAYFWYRLAEVAENPHAAVQIEKISSQLNQNQIQESELRVANWLTKHSAARNTQAQSR